MSDSERSASTTTEENPSSDVTSQSLSEPPSPEDLPFKRRKLEDNVTASQGNMLNDNNIVEPSPWIFDCDFGPPKYLKFAIEVLNNLEVSCQLSGTIDVDDNGFNITVYNIGNYVYGHLYLNKDRCQCTKPFYEKELSFFMLSLELTHLQDEGTLYLGSRSGTNKLDFRVELEGTQHTISFSVALNRVRPAISKFPDMSLFFTAIVPTDDFKHMIQHLLQQKAPHRVRVDIKKNIATLRAGNGNPWIADYAMLRADGSSATEAMENYSATFEWSNTSVVESLQKASKLDAEFVVLLHTEQPTSIILRFNLRDVGYLEFIKKCMTISFTRSK